MDVYNFYLTVDKINFKDEADGLKPFLFKNIGILQSFFFSFGGPGVSTQRLTLPRLSITLSIT
jgi:hypothetical protein